ncbi:MAG: DEAD/DEAH box helicase [Candidatus Riflebacteria bacterium]|nr:DEAD/DEAH box helicase [Candidatus Riflebacteria bacterium]
MKIKSSEVDLSSVYSQSEEYLAYQKKYLLLSPEDQIPLEIMGILDVELPAFSWQSVFSEYDVPFPDHDFFSYVKGKGLINESGNQLSCNSVVAEIAFRLALERTHPEEIFEKFSQFYESPFVNAYGRISEEVFCKGLRFDFYCGRTENFLANWWNVRLNTRNPDALDFADKMFLNVFDPDWMMNLPPRSIEVMLQLLFSRMILLSKPAAKVFDLFNLVSQKYPSFLSPETIRYIAEYLIFSRKLEQARKLAFSSEDKNLKSVQGLILFLEKDFVTAFQKYEEARAKGSKPVETILPKLQIKGFSELFYPLALYKSGKNHAIEHVLEYCTRIPTCAPGYRDLFNYLRNFFKAKIEGSDIPTYNLTNSREKLLGYSIFETYLAILTAFWAGKSLSYWNSVQYLETDFEAASSMQFHWLAKEINFLYSKVDPEKYSVWKNRQNGIAESPQKALSELFIVETPCEKVFRKIEKLVALKTEPLDKNDQEPKKRLIWGIHFIKYDQKLIISSISLMEQTRSKNGRWSSGKALEKYSRQPNYDDFFERDVMSLKAFFNPSINPFHSDRDLNILETLTNNPNVYVDFSEDKRIQIHLIEPTLRFEEKGGKIQIRFEPELEPKNSRRLIIESDRLIKILKATPEQMKLAEILREESFFPVSMKQSLIKIAGGLSRIANLHSDISIPDEEIVGTENIRAESMLRVLLTPDGSGLHAKFVIRPLGDGTQMFSPGKGSNRIIYEKNGKTVIASRDLNAEIENLAKLKNDCPIFSEIDPPLFEQSFNDSSEALEMMLSLETKKESIILEWPKGKKFGEIIPISFANLKLKINNDMDWFGIEGSAEVDQKKVMEFSQLIKLLESASGRFVPISEGKFLALADGLKKRLEDLGQIGDWDSDFLKIHRLSAPVIDELISDMVIEESCNEWKRNLKQLNEAANMNFELPSTLTAELRDYQSESFQWLSRMSHCGVGACLADDMGLGKTLEALTILLSRAEQGPSLIIAPTSVCMNWMHEIVKFTPTLKPILFGVSDRKKILNSLKPYDLLICTYGLLQQEAELFRTAKWNIIILDEAQAIKNMATQRSLAVMKLEGKFRMIMTGTPIENHLGELWNLFRFINPGLLGSFESFNEKYGTPIQKYNNKTAHSRLKRLVQFFILRRTKSQVLSELPSKTEITLEVELLEEEKAFYEALRKNALEKISSTVSAAGQKHILILAELTKLRRFCCNPKLIDSSLKIGSSKMQMLEGIVQELFDNKHKALIFSQFVGHLDLVRRMLESKGFSFQYLDGSTPARDRDKAVSEFQSGKGDFFLISLKAGGVGLNLTAADYVIHLDPWWNPAVENQASDRAHRIGQQRPVTIYRLITKDTIEERIVQLHEKKRDLADGLLEGTEVASKISTDELLNLLKD